MKEFGQRISSAISRMWNQPLELINPEMSPEAKQEEREELELMLEAATEDIVQVTND